MRSFSTRQTRETNGKKTPRIKSGRFKNYIEVFEKI
jgi:hypothetical protein